MYVRRFLEEPFLEADDFFPALLVTGARQVGKTTFLRKIAEPERRFVSLNPITGRKPDIFLNPGVLPKS